MLQKNKNRAILLRKLAMLICAPLFFSGCASLPFGKTTTYPKDLYRRIPYKIEGCYRVFSFFYATARNAGDGKTLSKSFRSDMSQTLTYGKLNVKIDPSIKIGKMLPRRLERKEMIGIESLEKLQEDAFIKELADALKASPHNSLLVIIHGYKDNFEFNAIKSAYFSYLLDINTPVLMFDWPGDQKLSIAGYLKAQSFAKRSGLYLGDFLAEIIREIKPGKLWIVASSLGCQVVCSAFDCMYQYADFADPDQEITHVVLTAPDVAQDEFDLQFKKEIEALSKKLTTYVSADDEALLISSIINKEKRLGREDAKEKEEEQLEEAKDLLYLKSLEPDKISIIDVTPINQSTFGHGYYLESPEFYDDFYMRIFDKEPHANRRLYLLKVKDNIDYWVLHSGK